MKPITVEQAVEVLNRAQKADPVAMHNLVSHRVICTRELTGDPTIQTGALGIGIHEVGMLGIINGIFGVDGSNIGFIAAETSVDGVLMGFRVYGRKTTDAEPSDA